MASQERRKGRIVRRYSAHECLRMLIGIFACEFEAADDDPSVNSPPDGAVIDEIKVNSAEIRVDDISVPPKEGKLEPGATSSPVVPDYEV